MKIGTLEITDKVFISDPCYDKDTWCTQTVDLPFGTYNCGVKTDKGYITNLYILKKPYKLSQCFIMQEELGSCGVDSGQLGIFNLNKFKERVNKKEFSKSLKHKFRYTDWKRFYNEKDNDVDTFYKCCCNHTLSNKRVGIIKDVGIVSSSGYGDGSYPVHPIKVFTANDYKIVGLYIDFISDYAE